MMSRSRRVQSSASETAPARRPPQVYLLILNLTEDGSPNNKSSSHKKSRGGHGSHNKESKEEKREKLKKLLLEKLEIEDIREVRLKGAN
jgi:hypothetical protein